MCVFYLICNNNNIIKATFIVHHKYGITTLFTRSVCCVRYIRVFGVVHGKAHRNVSTLSSIRMFCDNSKHSLTYCLTKNVVRCIAKYADAKV